MLKVSDDRIGIVVPAYRAERWIKTTIRSIVDQTHENWECVVVDDGSPDGTYDAAVKAASDPRIMVLQQANQGPSAARNYGYRQLSSNVQYVTFMDADDIYESDALEVLLSACKSRPELVGAHGLAEAIDEAGDPYRPGWFSEHGRGRSHADAGRLKPWPVEHPTCFRSLICGSPTFPPGLVLVHKAIYDATDLYDLSLKGCEDWDMLIRLARHGDLQLIDRVVLQYRRHGNNLGASPETPACVRRAFTKTFYSLDNTVEQKRELKLAWRARQRTIASVRCDEAKRALSERRWADALERSLRVPLIYLRWLWGAPSKN